MDEIYLNVIFNKLSFERGFGSSVWKRINRSKISLKKKINRRRYEMCRRNDTMRYKANNQDTFDGQFKLEN